MHDQAEQVMKLEGKHLPKILATTFFKKKSSFFASFVCQIIGVVCTAILSFNYPLKKNEL